MIGDGVISLPLLLVRAIINRPIVFQIVMCSLHLHALKEMIIGRFGSTPVKKVGFALF